jgi:hypothetical protein
MFIDETGNADIDLLSEPFTLTGVIFEYKYAINTGEDCTTKSQLEKKLENIKQLCFGRTDLGLHLDDISRGRKNFSSIDKSNRKKFYDELPTFLSDLDFTIISITIDKEKLKDYYSPSKDPYIVAFTHILQNFYAYISLNNADSARIVIESRDDAANLAIQKSFFDVYNSGTTHLNIDEKLRSKIKGFIIAKKGDPTYQFGLEIADILCNPLSRVRRGLIEANPKCMKTGEYGNDNKIFTAIKSKIFTATDESDLRNWGFQKVPITKKKRIWINNPVSNSSNTK